jgi:Leucine-rich repeat (LRR) protein
MTRLIALILNSNQIKEIKKGAFSGLDQSLKLLNLSDNRLEFIKSHHFVDLSNLEELFLRSNQISSINANSFRFLSKLLTLDLGNNCLFALDSALFRSLGRVSVLILDGNVIKTLDSNVFSDLVSLDSLTLSSNKIFMISSKMFENLWRIQKLDFSNNLLESLSTDTFQNLIELGMILLTSNFITDLNESFSKLKYLNQIDLSNNEIRNISRQFTNDPFYNRYFNMKNTTSELAQSLYSNNFTYKNIAYLDLSFVDLSQIILEFPFKVYAQSLVNLNLRSCNLNGFNVQFLIDLVNIKEIDLSDNKLNINSTFMDKSSQLEKISLSNVGLTSLNYLTFSLFKNLKAIDLSSNYLRQILKIHFHLNGKLEHLNLRNNTIDSIERATFSSNSFIFIDLSFNNLHNFSYKSFSMFIEYLRYFSLENNELKRLQPEFFNSFTVQLRDNSILSLPESYNIETQLNELDVSFNLISFIGNSTFSTATSLTYLNFSSNKIQSVATNSFVHLSKLKALDLSRNNLTSLDTKTFSGLISLSFLNLSFNSLQMIQRELFADFQSLTELNLNANGIKLIEDGSFNGLIYLRVLNLNASNFTNTTSRTFSGLDGLKEILIDASMFEDFRSLLNLKQNVKSSMVANRLGVVYYEPVNIVYDASEYLDSDCFMILYFVRNQLQLNLRDDSMMSQFTKFCGKMSRSDVQGLNKNYDYVVDFKV